MDVIYPESRREGRYANGLMWILVVAFPVIFYQAMRRRLGNFGTMLSSWQLQQD
jgi:hypothetical protein